jgi:rubredoxin
MLCSYTYGLQERNFKRADVTGHVHRCMLCSYTYDLQERNSNVKRADVTGHVHRCMLCSYRYDLQVSNVKRADVAGPSCIGTGLSANLGPIRVTHNVISSSACCKLFALHLTFIAAKSYELRHRFAFHPQLPTCLSLTAQDKT